MSGAEALFAVGLLCNAMQMLSFGREASHVYMHIRDGKSPDSQLTEYLEKAKSHLLAMQQAATTLPEDKSTLSSDEKEVMGIGEAIQTRVDKLREKLDELSVSKDKRGPAQAVDVIRKSSKALWSGNKDLRDLEADLHRYQGLLEGRLLRTICSQQKAAELQTTQSFLHADQQLQNFVDKVAVGHTDIVKLVASGTEDVKKLVSETTNLVREDIAESARKATSQAQKIQLLESLTYPDRRQKETQICDHWPGTFRWALDHRDRKNQGTNGPNDANRKVSDATSPGKQESARLIRWLRSDQDCFWVRGKAGSGKSTWMRYVASDRRTLAHLRMWRPHAHVLTHYFTKPGASPLQKSTKGMLLSLLLQVLQKKDELIDSILVHLSQRNPGRTVLNKYSPHDWTDRELMDAFCLLLTVVPSWGFCLFLDGLDEIVEESGQRFRPIDAINKLKQQNGVKICVSSREEPWLYRSFNTMPQFRMQDLTGEDIRLFAHERLSKVTAIPERKHEYMVREITRKADGVFLWVILATNSLVEGLEEGDSIDTLLERLGLMPSAIEDLFRDMLQRLGDDGKLSSLQAEASLYFNLALVPKDNPGEINLLEFTIAASDEIIDHFTHERPLSATQLDKRCDHVARRIRKVCAGLLESNREPDLKSNLGFGSGPGQAFWKSDGCLEIRCATSVCFIHRTAYDFLLDTDDGRNMLSYCERSHTEHVKNIVMGRLIRSRFIGWASWLAFHPYGVSLGSCLSLKGPKPQMVERSLGPLDATVAKQVKTIAKRWQLAGLFPTHVLWSHPHLLPHQYPNETLLLEYLQNICAMRNWSEARSCLGDLADDRFLHAVPIVFRTLTPPGTFDTVRFYSSGGIETLQYMLSRLTGLAAREKDAVASGVGDYLRQIWKLVLRCSIHTLVNQACFDTLDIIDEIRPDKPVTPQSQSQRQEILRGRQKELLQSSLDKLVTTITSAWSGSSAWHQLLVIRLRISSELFHMRSFLLLPLATDQCNFVVLRCNCATALRMWAVQSFGIRRAKDLLGPPPQQIDSSFKTIYIQGRNGKFITGCPSTPANQEELDGFLSDMFLHRQIGGEERAFLCQKLENSWSSGKLKTVSDTDLDEGKQELDQVQMDNMSGWMGGLVEYSHLGLNKAEYVKQGLTWVASVFEGKIYVSDFKRRGYKG